MKVLVLNAGSSTLKSQLLETDTGECQMKFLAEKVGMPDAFLNIQFAPDFEKQQYEMPNEGIDGCLSKLLEVMTNDPKSPIKSLSEIAAIGNRIVAGGEYFTKATLVDEKSIPELIKCEELAPLHNPHADECIKTMRKLLPDTPNVVVADTAFHMTMPPKAYMYPLPMHYYTDYRIRRYGAHGTSHRYVAGQAAEMLGLPLDKVNLITCHLGSGGSITAVKEGKSVDTSMGFTPLDGLMMGTRSGSLDPAIVAYIMRRDKISPDEMEDICNHKSGLLGISGVSDDMRDVESAAADGNENAQLAIDMYIYRIQKTIGAYYAILPRVDAVVITAGVGENDIQTREKIFAGLQHLGMILDPAKNDFRGEKRIISTDDSPIKLMVVPTNEELSIAQQTEEVVKAL